MQVFRALLESNAAFFAAQMTAMDAATRNSGEMIESLTLYMNKVRQAAITREIIEVVSGAQALVTVGSRGSAVGSRSRQSQSAVASPVSNELEAGSWKLVASRIRHGNSN